jgi:hypothetical protein
MTDDEMKLYLDEARAEARSSAADLAARQADLFADMRAGFATISADIADLRSDIRTTFATQNRRIAAMGVGVITCAAARGSRSIAGSARDLCPTLRSGVATNAAFDARALARLERLPVTVALSDGSSTTYQTLRNTGCRQAKAPLPH